MVLPLLLLLSFSSAGQNKSEQAIELIQSGLGLHYINGRAECNYIIDFYGDSLAQVPNTVFLDIDGKIITITDYNYSIEDFSNMDGNGALKKLLLNRMKSEREYLETDVYKSGLNIEKEFFLNKEGKQFLMWNFAVPLKFREDVMKAKQLVESPVYNSHLFFISNGVVVGISLSTMNENNIKEDLKYLKNTANRVDVFGGPIDKTAWFYKMESIQANEPFTYGDSNYKYEISIPYWFNVTQTNLEGVYSGSLPDIDNIKNAIFITAYKKTKFESFDAFNEHFITGYKFGDAPKFNKDAKWMGQKELEKPQGCNGISYKIMCMYGKSIYHCRYTTYETPTSFILINFTATEETYDFNQEKVEEFLSGFKVLVD